VTPDTWLSYNGKESIQAIVEFAQGKGIQDFFTWDASNDEASFSYHDALFSADA
jgi:GH18 family chitinase